MAVSSASAAAEAEATGGETFAILYRVSFVKGALNKGGETFAILYRVSFVKGALKIVEVNKGRALLKDLVLPAGVFLLDPSSEVFVLLGCTCDAAIVPAAAQVARSMALSSEAAWPLWASFSHMVERQSRSDSGSTSPPRGSPSRKRTRANQLQHRHTNLVVIEVMIHLPPHPLLLLQELLMLTQHPLPYQVHQARLIEAPGPRRAPLQPAKEPLAMLALAWRGQGEAAASCTTGECRLREQRRGGAASDAAATGGGRRRGRHRDVGHRGGQAGARRGRGRGLLLRGPDLYHSLS